LLKLNDDDNDDIGAELGTHFCHPRRRPHTPVIATEHISGLGKKRQKTVASGSPPWTSLMFYRPSAAFGDGALTI